MHQAPSRLLIAAAALALISTPALADNGVSPVVVVNPVTLNPATPNPVTIVNPPGAPPSTVTVGNPVDIAKAEGIQHPFGITLENNSCSQPNNCFLEFQVPANQRWVIERYGIETVQQVGAHMNFLSISTVIGGRLAALPLPVPANSVHLGAADATLAGDNIRIYAEPGSTVEVAASVDSGAFTTSATIIGQAIDVP